MSGKQSGNGKITVRFVPTSGQARTEEVQQMEAPLSVVLKEARVTGKNYQVTVDGRPVTDMKQTVSAGSVVVVTEKARGS